MRLGVWYVSERKMKRDMGTESQSQSERQRLGEKRRVWYACLAGWLASWLAVHVCECAYPGIIIVLCIVSHYKCNQYYSSYVCT